MRTLRRRFAVERAELSEFCSAACRFAAYEKYQTQNREDRYARRRQGRLDAKRDRHGCEECGTAIPIHTIATARFCSDMCQRRNYNRRRAIQLRDERLAKWAKRRAERKSRGR
jgi:endogenous inhibitor of DNA gyrase (YacG/DUF329 family)